jgi:glycosyltransferase involved in cell wall biosynthesis
MEGATAVIVDHLNTGLSGGAAIAATRLHGALRAAGVESHFWYAKKLPEESADAATGHVAARLRRHGPIGSLLHTFATGLRRVRLKWGKRRALAGRPDGLDLFSLPQSYRTTRWQLRGPDLAIIHLHWVAKMIDYRSFFASLPDDQPIVWTLHDLNPMTGGCHYPNGCRAYAERCGHCPQLGRPGANDLSHQTLHVKRQALGGKNLHIVAPSQWAADCARQSWLLQRARSLQVIPHGVDITQYAPRDRAACRQQLQLPNDRIVVGFGAASVADRRKGLRLLLAALNRIPNRRRLIGLVFGRGTIPSAERHLPQLTSVGYVDNPASQATVYSAADLLVVPSREELFGLTGLEALACGTPVVAFDCGGIPDYVRPMENGLLARPDDSTDLARQIEWLIDHPDARHRMGQRGRSMVVRQFDVRQQAARHIELYETLLKKTSTAAATSHAA